MVVVVSDDHRTESGCFHDDEQVCTGVCDFGIAVVGTDVLVSPVTKSKTTRLRGYMFAGCRCGG